MSDLLSLAAVFLAGMVAHEAAHLAVAKCYGVASAVGILYKPGWKALVTVGPCILTKNENDELTGREINLLFAPFLWSPFGLAATYYNIEPVATILTIAVVLALFSDIPAVLFGGFRAGEDFEVWRLYEFKNPGVFS